MASQVKTIANSRASCLSCLSCRKGKRRCDKSLPSCQLCLKKEIQCSYPPRRAESVTYQSHLKISTTLSPLSNPVRDHAAFSFLAPHLFLEPGLEEPQFDLPVPDSVRDIIGDMTSISEISVAFFECIHSWMPIISKRRFYTHLLHPLSRRQAELSLVAVCMKLYCTVPPEAGGGQTELYQMAKQFHFAVETAGLMSIHVLQAGVIIALYELSQAVYPAAHLSVSACARYGVALGIDKLGLELIGAENRMRSWIETEEMRRVWWSILTLDRFLKLSNSSHRLTTVDPTSSFYLPVDTRDWDDDNLSHESAITLLNALPLEMGILSRLAQAIYLLSQAFNFLASPVNDLYDSLDEIMQLRRTLIALIVVTDDEAKVRKVEFCSQSAICCSTLLLLDRVVEKQENCNTNDKDYDSASLISPESASALETLSRLACPYFTECLKDEAIMNSVSVFLIQATYQATSTIIRIGRGNLDPEMKESVRAIKLHLDDLSRRWKVAGIYRDILEAEEIMTTLRIA